MTANTKNLPIYKAGYELVRLVTDRVRYFTKDFRPTLGRKIQDEAVSLVLNVYKANAAENKSPYITIILEHTMVVEMLVQMSFDLRLIPPKDYAKAIEITGSLAKQAKGWKKYSERSRIQE